MHTNEKLEINAVTKCGPEKGHWVVMTQNQERETVMNQRQSLIPTQPLSNSL